MNDAILNFDGSTEPRNPGGYATGGWVLKINGGLGGGFGWLEASDSLFFCRGKGATNNVAEWSALGYGLRWLLDNKPPMTSLIIRGDSQLVIYQLTGEWQCNAPHLIKLRDRCREILAQLAEQTGVAWTAEWVPREQNEEADALSRAAYERETGKIYPTRVRKKKRKVR